MSLTPGQLDEQNAKAIEAEQFRQAQRNQRMKDLFSTDIGKLVLGDIIDACGMFKAHPPTSELDLVFDAGQRQVGLWILTCMGESATGAIERFMSNRGGLL